MAFFRLSFLLLAQGLDAGGGLDAHFGGVGVGGVHKLDAVGGGVFPGAQWRDGRVLAGEGNGRGAVIYLLTAAAAPAAGDRDRRGLLRRASGAGACDDICRGRGDVGDKL